MIYIYKDKSTAKMLFNKVKCLLLIGKLISVLKGVVFKTIIFNGIVHKMLL